MKNLAATKINHPKITRAPIQNDLTPQPGKFKLM